MAHYHLERKRAAVEIYRYAKRLRTETGYLAIKPAEFASIAAGGAPPSAISRWCHTDFSDAVLDTEEERRGARPLLTDEQQHLLVGYACSARVALEPVHLNTLKRFCVSHLSVTPSLPTLSRIMTSFGFSSQRSMSRNSRMVSAEVVEEALGFIEEVRSYEFPPHRIISMDETGLWSNVNAPKTYHFQGWYVRRPFLICSLSS